jgi:hypothetical protein
VKAALIPGTQIPDEPRNRDVIKVIETYRRAMEERDSSKLMSMAHKDYFEHSGTPTGSDDYGHKGLLRVLSTRMKQVISLRYDMKYLRIHWPEQGQAEVEVYVSASSQLKSDEGEQWHRMTDYNKLVLLQEKDRWLFLRGM